MPLWLLCLTLAAVAILADVLLWAAAASVWH